MAKVVHFVLLGAVCLCYGVVAELQCPENMDEAVHLPHETDCRKFYACSMAGEKIPMECGPNLQYDWKLQVCSFMTPACLESIQNGIPIDLPTKIPKPTKTKKKKTTTVKPISEEEYYPTSFDLLCQFNKHIDPLFIPDLNDYTVYYACHKGKALMMKCPYGLYWNVDLNRCM
jgi:hypothetical protein